MMGNHKCNIYEEQDTKGFKSILLVFWGFSLKGNMLVFDHYFLQDEEQLCLCLDVLHRS